MRTFFIFLFILFVNTAFSQVDIVEKYGEHFERIEMKLKAGETLRLENAEYYLTQMNIDDSQEKIKCFLYYADKVVNITGCGIFYLFVEKTVKDNSVVYVDNNIKSLRQYNNRLLKIEAHTNISLVILRPL